MLTQDQVIISIGLFIIIMLAVAWISWDIAVNQHNKKANELEKKVEAANKKYEGIIRKLEEDPQAYAIGLGVTYTLDVMDKCSAELRKSLVGEP